MCIVIDSTLLVLASGLLRSLVAPVQFSVITIAPSVVLEAWLQGYHLLPPV